MPDLSKILMWRFRSPQNSSHDAIVELLVEGRGWVPYPGEHELDIGARLSEAGIPQHESVFVGEEVAV